MAKTFNIENHSGKTDEQALLAVAQIMQSESSFIARNRKIGSTFTGNGMKIGFAPVQKNTPDVQEIIILNAENQK